MEEKTLFYDYPTQVKFFDDENEMWMGGIAYGYVIICGCCGATIDIAELYEDSPVENPIVEYEEWVSIHEEIMGED